MLGIAETGPNTAISKRFLPARRMPAGIPPAKAPTQQPTRQRTHHLRQRQHHLLLFRAQLGGVSAGQRIGQHLRGQLATGRGQRPGSRIATIGFRQQRTQDRMRQQLQSRIGIAAVVRVQLAADEVSGIGRQCIGRDLTSALSRHTTHQRRRHCVQCTVVLIEAPHFPAPLFAWLFAAATLLRTGTRFHRPQSQGRVDLQHSSNPRPDQHVEGTHGQPDEKHDASAPGSPPKPKGRTGPDLYPSARREGTLEREPRQQGTDWCSYNMTSFEPRKKFIHKHNPGHTEDEAQHGGYGANQRCENCSLRKAAYPRTQRNAYE